MGQPSGLKMAGKILPKISPQYRGVGGLVSEATEGFLRKENLRGRGS